MQQFKVLRSKFITHVNICYNIKTIYCLTPQKYLFLCTIKINCVTMDVELWILLLQQQRIPVSDQKSFNSVTDKNDKNLALYILRVFVDNIMAIIFFINASFISKIKTYFYGGWCSDSVMYTWRGAWSIIL